MIQECEIMETININMWYNMEKRYVQNKESWLTSLFLFNNACQTCYNNTEIRHKNKMNFGYLVLVFTIFFLRGILGMKKRWIFARFSIHFLQKYLLHFELIRTLFLFCCLKLRKIAIASGYNCILFESEFTYCFIFSYHRFK